MSIHLINSLRTRGVNLAIRKTKHICGCHGYNNKHYNTASDNVRLRFAPSPTGQLHLGGLRTALYNYLYAKAHGGKFILRIEDTDQTRLIGGAAEKLVEMLTWAGIHFDEGPHVAGEYGPYVQSERISLYKEEIKTLLKNGLAYHCFCTPKRLELLRKDAARRGETPRYDNRCRHLTPEQAEEKLASNIPHVIRLKMAPLTEPWQDLVYGSLSYDVTINEGDPVLIKSDQFPTYHFANVVDDHYMNITHVLRGVEWQISTPKHIMLYRALGWKEPQFAHLPLIMNKDGSKLSKRQDDIHVEHFKNCGYYPEAVLNLLTLAGSGFTRESTIGMDMQQLISHFDISSMRTNSTRVDTDRLDEFNGVHLRHRLANHKTRSQLIGEVRGLVHDAYSHSFEVGGSLQQDVLNEDYISNILTWAADRISSLKDLCKQEFRFLWIIPSSVNPEDFPDTSKNVINVLELTIEWLTKQDVLSLSDQELNKELRTFSKKHNFKYGPYMRSLRAALSGLQEGPSVVEMITVLGKDNSVQRLKLVKERLEHFQQNKTQCSSS